jgi:hypothetical protein
MAEHRLKTHYRYFDEIHKGSRTYDVRYNEDEYKIADFVVFEEIYTSGWPTGREIRATITHITDLKAYAEEFFYEFIFDPLIAFQFRVIEVTEGRFDKPHELEENNEKEIRRAS